MPAVNAAASARAAISRPIRRGALIRPSTIAGIEILLTAGTKAGATAPRPNEPGAPSAPDLRLP